MVCIYCGGDTRIFNSRLQKRENQVWRRRRCLQCKASFTTHEGADLAAAIRVRLPGGHGLVPFLRPKLFLSIYESCKHRATSLEDAAALTDHIIAKLLRQLEDGTLTTAHIAHRVHAVLEHFDSIAASVYAAYHAPALHNE